MIFIELAHWLRRNGYTIKEIKMKKTTQELIAESLEQRRLYAEFINKLYEMAKQQHLDRQVK